MGENYPVYNGFSLDDVNKTDSCGDTPLHIASIRGKEDEALALLEGGANVNAAGDMGSTPLHYAVAQGHINIVKLLLSRGASKDVMSELGSSPLQIAEYKMNERKEILELLRSYKNFEKEN